MRRPTTLACSAERSRSVSKLETWRVCSTRSSGGERRKRCKTCLCLAWLSLGFGIGFYSLSDWFLLSLSHLVSRLFNPFPPPDLDGCCICDQMFHQECEDEFATRTAVPPCFLSLSGNIPGIDRGGLTEGREHKNNPPKKLCSFLDPLDDTPFLFLFVLFVFLSGLVALSLI